MDGHEKFSMHRLLEVAWESSSIKSLASINISSISTLP